MGTSEIVESEKKQGKKSTEIVVEKCTSIFLWPFYLKDEHEKRIADPKRISLPEPWKPLTGDNSTCDHHRAKEYFDPQALGSIAGQYGASDLNVVFSKESMCGGNWLVEPLVTVFRTGICILSLKAKPEAEITLEELLNFNEHFRYTDLMDFQRRKHPDKFKYRVHSSNTWKRKSQDVAHSGELIEDIVGELAEACLSGFQKMICCTAVMARDVSDDDKYRLAALDSAESFLPNERFSRQFEGIQVYDRWMPAQTIAFSNYSMCWILDENFPDWLCDDAVLVHFPILYAGIMGHLVVHQYGALSVLSRELAEKAPTQKDHAQQVKELRQEVLSFTNNAWYDRITFEVQGHEMYTAWRDAIQVKLLHSEIRRALQDTDEYLSMVQSQEINRNLFVMQYVLAFIGGAGFGLAFLSTLKAFLPELWILWPWILPASVAFGLVADVACWLLSRNKQREQGSLQR